MSSRILLLVLVSFQSLLAQTGRVVPEQLEARLVLDDGTPPPRQLQLISDDCLISEIFGNGTVIFFFRYFHESIPSSCLVKVNAIGLRPVTATLRPGATVVLKRLGLNEGSSISISTIKAPPPARKTYGKGSEALLKGDLNGARKHFQAATALYPDYALAWSELATTLTKLGDSSAARIALYQAIRIDKTYIKPLVQLAALEAASSNWPAVITATQTAIALKPVEFPGAYYYRALAHLEVKEWKQAIQAFDKTIEIDPLNDYPLAPSLRARALGTH